MDIFFQIASSMRNSIVAIVIFFIVGLILLARIPKVKALSPIDSG